MFKQCNALHILQCSKDPKYSQRPALLFLKPATFPANSESKGPGTAPCSMSSQNYILPLCSRESYLPKQLAKAFFCTLPNGNPATRDIQASSLQLNILLQQTSKSSPHTSARWPCNKTWYNIRKLHKPAIDHWCLWSQKKKVSYTQVPKDCLNCVSPIPRSLKVSSSPVYLKNSFERKANKPISKLTLYFIKNLKIIRRKKVQDCSCIS